MKTVLGIDLGTQSLKVLFYDFEQKKIAATASAPIELTVRNDGSAEQLAHWWTDALAASLEKISPTIKASAVAISVSGQQHGFVALDQRGEVLIPVKLWCDTSTATQCDELIAAYGGASACINEIGNSISPGYTASKVLWMKQRRPYLYEKLHTILLPHDYLNFFLTGERCMEFGDASGTGLLNIYTREWSDKMLGAIDNQRNLRECLPPLIEPGQIVGSLRADRAHELGLPAAIPVATGGGDNMMGAIGTGNVKPGVLTISLGTSGTVYAYSDRPVVDPEGSIAAFCSSTGGWLPLICTMNCTVSSELMRNLLDYDLQEFEREISLAPTGADGLITLPFFNGERTPNLPNAKGCVLGIDTQNCTRENLLRSAVEGATFGLRFGIDAFRRMGMQIDKIRLTGGGASSATWRQIVADICQAPVVTLAQNEGAAFGAALQALWMLESTSGNAGDIAVLVDQHLEEDDTSRCEPNDAAVARYNNIYSDYRRAVDAITQYYSASKACASIVAT
jgi:xylulokinase